MAEPISSTGTAAFLKVYGITLVVVLAAILITLVVMMIRMPKNPREWAAGLICTVVSSITGGAFLIMYLGLHHWEQNLWGVIALGGIFFTCGMPGWFLVRLTANFMDERESKNILEVVKELKDEIKGGKE